MDDDKKAKLEAAGWVETTVEEFLGIDEGEQAKKTLPFNQITFTVTVHDGCRELTFEFELPSNTSIQTIVEAITKLFTVAAPGGKLTRGYEACKNGGGDAAR